MERIWAPWRMVYILAEAAKEKITMSGKDKKKQCIFCDLPEEGNEKFRENLILSCSSRVFIILNRYPYNNAHLMVVPRAHVKDPSELSCEDYRLLTELLRRTTSVLKEAVNPDGINLGMNLGRTAGAGIEQHCHYHLVPRWDGDTNFMPVVGGAKVISEDLWASYDRLYPLMSELAEKTERDLQKV